MSKKFEYQQVEVTLDNVEEKLNTVGQDGWQLVSFIHNPHARHHSVLLMKEIIVNWNNWDSSLAVAPAFDTFNETLENESKSLLDSADSNSVKTNGLENYSNPTTKALVEAVETVVSTKPAGKIISSLGDASTRHIVEAIESVVNTVVPDVPMTSTTYSEWQERQAKETAHKLQNTLIYSANTGGITFKNGRVVFSYPPKTQEEIESFVGHPLTFEYPEQSYVANTVYDESWWKLKREFESKSLLGLVELNSNKPIEIGPTVENNSTEQSVNLEETQVSLADIYPEMGVSIEQLTKSVSQRGIPADAGIFEFEHIEMPEGIQYVLDNVISSDPNWLVVITAKTIREVWDILGRKTTPRNWQWIVNSSVTDSEAITVRIDEVWAVRDVIDTLNEINIAIPTVKVERGGELLDTSKPFRTADGLEARLMNSKIWSDGSLLFEVKEGYSWNAYSFDKYGNSINPMIHYRIINGLLVKHG